ncbi:ABC-three component system middle component 2 [Rhodococcus erythropolis]|uniref:ABC-three component system middle component 2 n=1 Tax=Rhodococcus erythropolis TaxID=1833 RepID=UPI001F2921D8|nr:ABC-three component system middle component 2 [Rhodococcus erythropolis]
MTSIQTLNGPVEIAMRVLILLREAFPQAVDVHRLVLLDYALLHSHDLGGPDSLHPPLPGRRSELGMKRTLIHQGIEVLQRANLVVTIIDDSGWNYQAGDGAQSFIACLESSYVFKLRERSSWVMEALGSSSNELIREKISDAFDDWSEEFHETDSEN